MGEEEDGERERGRREGAGQEPHIWHFPGILGHKFPFPPLPLGSGSSEG